MREGDLPMRSVLSRKARRAILVLIVCPVLLIGRARDAGADERVQYESMPAWEQVAPPPETGPAQPDSKGRRRTSGILSDIPPVEPVPEPGNVPQATPGSPAPSTTADGRQSAIAAATAARDAACRDLTPQQLSNATCCVVPPGTACVWK